MSRPARPPGAYENAAAFRYLGDDALLLDGRHSLHRDLRMPWARQPANIQAMPMIAIAVHAKNRCARGPDRCSLVRAT